MSRYAFHPEAFTGLDEVWEYIAEDNIDAADGVIAEIFNLVRNLVPFQHRGHRRPDLTARPLRFIGVRDYLIAYVPDEDPVWVLSILHGKRDPRIMAAILRDRGEQSPL